MVGLAFDVCVKATALDAKRLGFLTTVIRAASAAVELEAGDADRSAVELAAAGVSLA